MGFVINTPKCKLISTNFPKIRRKGALNRRKYRAAPPMLESIMKICTLPPPTVMLCMKSATARMSQKSRSAAGVIHLLFVRIRQVFSTS